MSYNSGAFISNNHTKYIGSIHDIRKAESNVRNPKARLNNEKLKKQKEDIIYQTPEKLLALYEQLKNDPLVNSPKSKLMTKNLILHLQTVLKYATEE